ncbi:exported hypothetical protein [Syntrophobacter sp. SbD2]|nr:exported hypothetical protein [Syntrophobacter sp. SbD2]
MLRRLLFSAAVTLFLLSVSLPARAVEVPSFIQVGKSYLMYWAGGNAGGYTVREIDKSGWIKVSGSSNDIVWINLEHVIKIQPLK